MFSVVERDQNPVIFKDCNTYPSRAESISVGPTQGEGAVGRANPKIPVDSTRRGDGGGGGDDEVTRPL